MTGLDLRVNTDFLSDPVRLGLSAEANMALQCLQLHALRSDTDGYIEAAALAVSPRYLGIPWVNEDTLTELEEAGLVTERDAAGVQVVWEWQSTVAEREANRERKRNNQRAKRERDRENQEIATAVKDGKLPSVPSRLSVTGDSPDSNRIVGKDRHRKGENRGDSATPSGTPTGTVEPRTVFPNASDSEAEIQATPSIEEQDAFSLPGIPLFSPAEEERARKRSLVAELHAQGLSVREIARHVGITKSAVHRQIQGGMG